MGKQKKPVQNNGLAEGVYIPGVTPGPAPSSSAQTVEFEGKPEGVTIPRNPRQSQKQVTWTESPFEKKKGYEKQHEDWKRYSSASESAYRIGADELLRGTLAKNGVVDLRNQENVLNKTTQAIAQYARSKDIRVLDDKTVQEALAENKIELGELSTDDLLDIAKLTNQRRMADDALDGMRRQYGVQDKVAKQRQVVKQQESQANERGREWVKGLMTPTPPPTTLSPQGIVTSNTKPPVNKPVDFTSGKGEYQFSRGDLHRTPEFRLTPKDDALARKRPEYVRVPVVYDAVKTDPHGAPIVRKQATEVEIPSDMLGNTEVINKTIEKSKQELEFESQFTPLTQVPVKPVSYIDETTGQEQLTGEYEIGDIDQYYRQLDNEFISKFTAAQLTSKYYTADQRPSRDAAIALAYETLKYVKSHNADDGFLDSFLRGAEFDTYAPLLSWTGWMDDYVTSKVKDPALTRIAEQYKQAYMQAGQLAGARRIYGKTLPKELFATDDKSVAVRATTTGMSGLFRGALSWIAKPVEQFADIADANVFKAQADFLRSGKSYQESVRENLTRSTEQQQNDIWSILTNLSDLTSLESVPNVSELRQLLPDVVFKNQMAQEKGNARIPGQVQSLVGEDQFIEQLAPAVTQLLGSIYAGPFKISSATVGKASQFITSNRVGQTIAKSKYMQALGKTFNAMNPELIPNVKAGAEMAAVMSMSHLLENFPNANPEELEQSAISGALFAVTGNLIAQKVFMPWVAKYRSIQTVLENPTTRQAYIENLVRDHGAERAQEIYAKSVNGARTYKDLAYAMGGTFGNPLQGMLVTNITGQEYDGVMFAIDAILGGLALPKLSRSMRNMKKPLGGTDLEAMIAAREAYEDNASAERAAKKFNGKADEQAVEINSEEATKVAENVPDNTATTNEPTPDKAEANLNDFLSEEYEAQLRQRFDADRGTIEQPATATPSEPIAYSELVNQDSFSESFNEIQREALNLVNRNAADTPVIYHTGKTEYDPATNTIYINQELKGTEAERNALLHEGVHAATVKILKSDKAFRDEFIKLKQRIETSRLFQNWMVKPENNERALYMMQSPEEFMAGLIDNVNGVADVIVRESNGFGNRMIDAIKGAFNRNTMSNVDVYTAVRDTLANFPRLEVVQTGAEQASTIADVFDQANGNNQPVNDDLFDQLTNGLRLDFILDDTETYVDPDSNLGIFRDLAKDIGLVGERVNRMEARANLQQYIQKLRRLGIEDEVAYKFFRETTADMYPDWDTYSPAKKAEILNADADRIGKDNYVVNKLRELTKEAIDTEGDKPFGDYAKQDVLSIDDLSKAMGMKSADRLQGWIQKHFDTPELIFERVEQSIDRKLAEMYNDENVVSSGDEADNTQMAMRNEFKAKAMKTVRDYVINNHNKVEVAALEILEYRDGSMGVKQIPGKERVSTLTGRRLVRHIQKPTAMYKALDNVRERLSKSSRGDAYRFFEQEGITDLLNILTKPQIGVVTDTKVLEESGLISSTEDIASLLVNPNQPGWFFLPGSANGNMLVDLRQLFNGPFSSYTLGRLTKQIETINLVDYLDSEQTWGVPNGNQFVPRVLGAFDLWKLADMANNNERFDLGNAKQSIVPKLASYIYNESFANKIVNQRYFDVAMSDADNLAQQANDVINKLAAFYAPNEQGVKPVIRFKEMQSNIIAENAPYLASALAEFYSKITDPGMRNVFTVNPKTGKPEKNSNKYYKVATQASYRHYKDAKTLEAVLKSQGKLFAPLDLRDVEPANRQTITQLYENMGIRIDDKGNVKLRQWIMSDEWAEANPEIWAAFSGQTTAQRVVEPTMPATPAGVKLTAVPDMMGQTKYFPKDQAKADRATKFIGRGSARSSTAQYAEDFGELANTGQYTANDVVFASAEGNRANRVRPNFDELQKAVDAGATFITDDKANRSRPYNIGERDIADFLTNRNYVEVEPGVWQLPVTTTAEPKQLIPPSKLHDGASFLINKATHDFLASAFNSDPEQTGGLKFGYGGDWIWKSAFAEQYDTGVPVVDSFLNDLRQKGFASIAVQSAIKSQGKNYGRTDIVDGKRYVYDHDGTLVGMEDNGQFKAMSKEERMALYSNNTALPHLVREYDLVGDNAIGYAHASTVADNNSFRGVSASFDRTAYVYGSSGTTLQNIAKTLQANVGDRFQRIIQADQLLLATAPLRPEVIEQLRSNPTLAESLTELNKIYKPETGTVRNKNLYSYIKRLANMAENSKADGDIFDSPTTKRAVTRGLKNALLDDNIVDVRSIHVLDAIYGGIISGDKNALRTRLLQQEFDNSRKGKTLGKLYRLSPYVPADNHIVDGVDVSIKWQQVAAEEEAARLGLGEEEAAQFIKNKLLEHKEYLNNEIFAKHMPNGKMDAYGEGAIMSVKDIDAYNTFVQQERASGKDIPYLLLGSKFVTKLNPPDALDSYTGRVLVGADSRKNTGILINSEFLIDAIGRDFDGDEYGVFFENPDWGGKFIEFHDELVKQGTHFGDPIKKQSLPKTNLMGNPYPKQPLDQRSTTLDNITKTQKANSVGFDKIDAGIANLNAFYESLGYMKRDMEMRRSNWIESRFIDFRIGGDLESWKVADNYTKQAQYDTWKGLDFAPNDVFVGSRVSDIRVKNVGNKKPPKEIVNAVEVFKQTGTVYPALLEAFVNAYKSYIPTTQPQFGYGKNPSFISRRIGFPGGIADLNDPTYGAGINETVRRFEAPANRIIPAPITDRLSDVGKNLMYDSSNELQNLYGRQIYNSYAGNFARSLEEVYRAYTSGDRYLEDFRKVINIAGQKIAGASNVDARFDFVSNMTQDSAVPFPDLFTSDDPVNIALAHEVTQRTFAKVPTEIPINGNSNLKWVVSKDAISLVTPHAEYGINEVLSKGKVNPDIQMAMDDAGINMADLFPPHLINPATAIYDEALHKVTAVIGVPARTRTANIKKALAAFVAKRPQDVHIITTLDLPKNKDVFNSIKLPENVVKIDRFGLSDKGVVDAIRTQIDAALKQGKRAVIIKNTVPMPLPADLLDHGAAVGINRGFTDKDRVKFIGKIAGASSEIGATETAIGYGMRKVEPDPYRRDPDIGFDRPLQNVKPIYDGIKEMGGNIFDANGNDILQSFYEDVVFTDSVKRLHNKAPNDSIDTLPGERFGLFNGKVSKVAGYDLQKQRAGRLNRLNKHVGKKLSNLSWEDTTEINQQISEYLKSEFGEGADANALYDYTMSIIDPQQLRTIEEGLYRKYSHLTEIEPNGDTRGNNLIRAAKSLYLTQALTEVNKIAKRQSKVLGVVPRDWWDKFSLLSSQDAPTFVKHFANDKRNFSLFTPVNETVGITVDAQGNVISNVSKNTLEFQYDRTQKPKYASMESETFVRHGYRKQYVNSIKDKMAADLSDLRENMKKRFEPITDNNIIDLAREAISGTAFDVKATSVFNGINDPSIAVTIGNKIFNTDANGYLPDAELTSAAEEILAGIQELEPYKTYKFNMDPKVTRQQLINALKIGITAKAQNVRFATYQHSIATSLEEYVRNLYEENTPNEVVQLSEEEIAAGIRPVSAKPPIESTEFADLYHQAKTIADELRSEAQARIQSSMMDNINAMQHVNYDTFADVVTMALDERQALVDQIKSANNKDQRKQLEQELEQMYKDYGKYFYTLELDKRYPRADAIDEVTAGKIVLGYLTTRRDAANRKNKQFTKVNSFFKRELIGNDFHRPAMYDQQDYNILKYVFQQPDSYNDDLLYRRNADVLQSTFLNINALFTNGYNVERNIRKALGKSTLDSDIAENNLMSLFKNDDTIYTENIDVHSTRGWRSQITKAAEQNRTWLTSEEIGLPLTTPVAVTYVADSANNIKTITGRIIGVVRMTPEVVVTKAVTEARERYEKQKAIYDEMAQSFAPGFEPEYYEKAIARLEAAKNKLNLDVEAGPKDVAVIYNQENGSSSVIDLEAITQVQKGSVNGWLANKANDARARDILKIFGSEQEIGEFLSKAKLQAFQSLPGESVVQSYRVNDANMPIQFFAKIGRTDTPTSVAAILDKTAQVLSAGASQWRYGYGKETATVLASVLAMPFIGINYAAAGVAYSLGKAGFKYVRNLHGNYLGFATRAAQVFPQLFDSEALPGTIGANIKTIGKNAYNQVKGIFQLLNTEEIDKYMREGTPAAATAKQRLQKGAGLSAELLGPTNIITTNSSTIPFVEMLNEGRRIKKEIDGLGRFLTAADLDYINEVIQKNMRYAKNARAAIRQGQLNLTFVEPATATAAEQYMFNLDELEAMNFNRLNQMLALSGKSLSFLDPVLVATSRSLMATNNLRLRVFTRQGGSEQKGVLRGGSSATKAFERLNEGLDVRTNPAAVSSFVQQGIETLQGKFDEKAYHMQTPFGHAFNLFSQYFRRFAQRTAVDPIQEKQFWDSWYQIIGEDKEFANTMMREYGLDLGNQVAQRTFTAWSPDDGPQALRLSIAGKLAFAPLAVYGLSQLINTFLEAFNSNVDWEIKRELETYVQMVGGGENPIGNAVKVLFEGMSLFYTRDLEKQSTARAAEYLMRDALAVVPGGAGVSPAFDAGALLGLYSMHKAGILPNLPSDMRWDKRVTSALGPMAIPVQAPLDVVSGIERGGKAMKRFTKFVGKLTGEEEQSTRRKRRRRKKDADSE